MKKQSGAGAIAFLTLAFLSAFWAYGAGSWLGVLGLIAGVVGAFILWVWVVHISQQSVAPQPILPVKPWAPAPYSAEDHEFAVRQTDARRRTDELVQQTNSPWVLVTSPPWLVAGIQLHNHGECASTSSCEPNQNFRFQIFKNL